MSGNAVKHVMPDLSSSTGNGEEGACLGATSGAHLESSGIGVGGASSSDDASPDGDLGEFCDDVEEDSDLEGWEEDSDLE